MYYPYVILVNNNPETLFSIHDFEDLIDREMGHDAANFFYHQVEELLETIDQLEEELRDG